MSKQTTDFTTVAAEGQKPALTAIAQAHESMLRLAELGTSSMPTSTLSVASLPKRAELVQAGYDFMGKLLEEQKSFARTTLAQALTQK